MTPRAAGDAAGNLLAETDGSNNVTRYYIHGAGLLAMVTPDEDVYCYHYNATGSTVAVTDDSQEMVNKYSYDPFGNIGEQVEAVPQPFKYVGQFGVMYEPNGFYYMRARYYDPNVGRFISEDPSGFAGGDVNLSNYVGGNPVNFVDPDGENALVVGGIVVGAGGYYLYTHSVSFRAFVDSVMGSIAPILSPVGEVAGIALDPQTPTAGWAESVRQYNNEQYREENYENIINEKNPGRAWEILQERRQQEAEAQGKGCGR